MATGSGRAVIDGEWVRRPMQPWLESVSALLRHFEGEGLEAVPRDRGGEAPGDEQVVSFVEGEVAEPPWPEELRRNEALESVARLLRRCHDASESFDREGASERRWIAGSRVKGEGEVVLHGDVSMSNLVWKRGRAIALIDWEFAEPGPAWIDVLQAIFSLVPLYDDSICASLGFAVPPPRAERVRIFLDAYRGERAPRYAFPSEVGLGEVVRDLVGVLARDRERFETLGGEHGLEPWASAHASGYAQRNLELARWVERWGRSET